MVYPKNRIQSYHQQKIITKRMEHTKMMKDRQDVIETTAIDMVEVTVPNDDMLSVLKQIQKDTAEQKEMQRQRLFLSKISTGVVTLLTIIVIGTLVWVIPTLNDFVQTIDVAVVQLTEVMSEISVITNELQEAEFVEILNNVNSLLEQSNEKLSALDVEEFNKALKNLGDALSPLAKLFGGRN